MKQMTFADAEYAGKRKQTRKELFLIEMDRVVPWKGLIALIEPHYPKGEGGRPAYPLMAMLRVHLMQNWFGYSDPAMEEALYETTILRQFAGLSLERIPDETTILNFRRLLEKHELAAGILAVINGYDQCAEFDQEQRGQARSGNASDQEGQPVLLRHEGPHRRR